MTYNDAIEFLFNSLPVFQREGATAYKPGLATSLALDDIFGNPHRNYAVVHVAGTNGKGSTSHTLAAVLTRAGYKVGLYTSPHIFDFRERIRVNGVKISSDAVVDFVERWQSLGSDLRPSFFELTSTMAFEYFSREKVDIAIIETGLGGRLDSTNIVNPVLSIITNISPDHTALLGDTLEKIASEKAGIIKRNVPVVIGERQEECAPVFETKAAEMNAPLTYAPALEAENHDSFLLYPSTPFGEIRGELTGEYQIKNAATIAEALCQLRKLGWNIPDKAVKEGFANVCSDTGLLGRWTVIATNPLTVIDTGHNIGGWEYITHQLSFRPEGSVVHLIVGFVNDKDISAILHKISEIKADLRLYFSTPSVPRGLQAEILAERASQFGLSGEVIDDVNEALAEAASRADASDMILIAGSNFLIADLKLDL